MRRLVGVLFTVAIGAVAAYMFDPERGRTRRALARDKAIAMSHRVNSALEGRSRHWSNIALGYLAEARRLLDRGRRTSRETLSRVGKSA
jgi:gas vesicle protein